MLLILFKELCYRSAFLIVGFCRFLCMLSKKAAVEFFDVVVCGNRNKQVPPACTYFILNVAFLVSGMRIAEPDTEPVMGTEPGKQLGLMNLIHDPAANAGCVVEHKKRRDTPNVVEDILKPLADAFCSFAPKYLVISVVAEREGYGKVFPADAFGIFIEIRLSEVNLCAAGLPDEFLCSFGLDIGPDSVHEFLDRIIASGKTVFLLQAFVDALGSMPLLGPVFLVLLKPFRDDINVRRNDGCSGFRHGRLR